MKDIILRVKEYLLNAYHVPFSHTKSFKVVSFQQRFVAFPEILLQVRDTYV